MLDTVYQLSLFIHSIDIDKSIMPKNNQNMRNEQIWCVLSIDGSDVPVSTSAAQMSSHSEFNYALDIQFKPPSGRCYLFLTLCSFASESEDSDLAALARAKVSIDKLPLNGPNAFRIPLMTQVDPKKKEKNKKKANVILKNMKGDEFQQVASILISGYIDPPIEQKSAYDL